MSASSQIQLVEGEFFHGRYEIVGAIGVGGMGVVYEVIDSKTRRRRALKVMLPSVVEDDDLRRRFRQEAIVAAEIETEHIVETLDAGVDEDTGSPFLVLELLKGQPLDEMIETRGGLPHDEVLQYLHQAALALDKAHEASVVHRDLKPQNLFITYRDDGTPRLKILDFGIAKVISGSKSAAQTRGILGTPLYMAPEQVHTSVGVSGRSDIYAIGHIAYTMLVGESYWSPEERAAESIYAMLLTLAKGPTQSPSDRAMERMDIELPGAFDAWFAQVTAEDPKERFATAAVAIRALGRALHIVRRSSAVPGQLSATPANKTTEELPVYEPHAAHPTPPADSPPPTQPLPAASEADVGAVTSSTPTTESELAATMAASGSETNPESGGHAHAVAARTMLGAPPSMGHETASPVTQTFSGPSSDDRSMATVMMAAVALTLGSLGAAWVLGAFQGDVDDGTVAVPATSLEAPPLREPVKRSMEPNATSAPSARVAHATDAAEPETSASAAAAPAAAPTPTPRTAPAPQPGAITQPRPKPKTKPRPKPKPEPGKVEIVVPGR